MFPVSIPVRSCNFSFQQDGHRPQKETSRENTLSKKSHLTTDSSCAQQRARCEVSLVVECAEKLPLSGKIINFHLPVLWKCTNKKKKLRYKQEFFLKAANWLSHKEFHSILALTAFWEKEMQSAASLFETLPPPLSSLLQSTSLNCVNERSMLRNVKRIQVQNYIMFSDCIHWGTQTGTPGVFCLHTVQCLSGRLNLHFACRRSCQGAVAKQWLMPFACCDGLSKVKCLTETNNFE